MRHVLGLAALLIFAGCGPFESYEVVRSERVHFTLVRVYPPKHFYVDLKDDAGRVWPHIYVSKHCNQWRALALGQQFDLVVEIQKNSQGERSHVLARSICPGGS